MRDILLELIPHLLVMVGCRLMVRKYNALERYAEACDQPRVDLKIFYPVPESYQTQPEDDPDMIRALSNSMLVRIDTLAGSDLSEMSKDSQQKIQKLSWLQETITEFVCVCLICIEPNATSCVYLAVMIAAYGWYHALDNPVR